MTGVQTCALPIFPSGVITPAKLASMRDSNRIAEIREAVMHPEALLARSDEPGLAKMGEMARRGRLRDVERRVDIADADLARREQAENPAPRFVGERREHVIQRHFHIRLDEYTTGPIYSLLRISRVPRRTP